MALSVLTATLPRNLRPSSPDGLQRFGSEGDGGYLIDPRDIAVADGLLALGLDRDWNFEREFLRHKPAIVHAYDGCTSPHYLLRDVPQALNTLNWRWACRRLLEVVDYLRFFHTSPRVRHIRQFVGTAQYAYEDTNAVTVPLSKVFEDLRAAGSRKPFLKIDIEGAEYMMLHELISRADATAALAIEFHDCDARIGEISAFVQRYPLTLVHVHANPYGGIGDGGIPRALELTFSSSADETDSYPTLPHPLDRPNDGTTDIVLRFA